MNVLDPLKLYTLIKLRTSNFKRLNSSVSPELSSLGRLSRAFLSMFLRSTIAICTSMESILTLILKIAFPEFRVRI